MTLAILNTATFDSFRRQRAISGFLVGFIIALLFSMKGCASSIVERDLEFRTILMEGVINNIELRRGQDVALERMTREDLRDLCLDLIQVAYSNHKNYYILLHVLSDKEIPHVEPPEGWRR